LGSSGRSLGFRCRQRYNFLGHTFDSTGYPNRFASSRITPARRRGLPSKFDIGASSTTTGYQLRFRGDKQNTLPHRHIRLSIEVGPRRWHTRLRQSSQPHAKPRQRMNPRNNGQKRSAMEKGDLREGRRRKSSARSVRPRGWVSRPVAR